MVGRDESFDMYGVMPTGLVWLFRLVENQRQKYELSITPGLYMSLLLFP